MHLKCGYEVMSLFLQEQPKLIHLSEDRICTFVLEMMGLLGGNVLSRQDTRHLLKLYGDNQSNLPLPASKIIEK